MGLSNATFGVKLCPEATRDSAAGLGSSTRRSRGARGRLFSTQNNGTLVQERAAACQRNGSAPVGRPFTWFSQATTTSRCARGRCGCGKGRFLLRPDQRLAELSSPLFFGGMNLLSIISLV